MTLAPETADQAQDVPPDVAALVALVLVLHRQESRARARRADMRAGEPHSSRTRTYAEPLVLADALDANTRELRAWWDAHVAPWFVGDITPRPEDPAVIRARQELLLHTPAIERHYDECVSDTLIYKDRETGEERRLCARSLRQHGAALSWVLAGDAASVTEDDYLPLATVIERSAPGVEPYWFVAQHRKTGERRRFTPSDEQAAWTFDQLWPTGAPA